MVLNIINPKETTPFPIASSALLVPTGYATNSYAFDSTAIDILNFFRASNFDIDILSTPETFSTIELNSNIIRLGKFIVKDMVLPVFLSLISAFVYDNYVDNSKIDDDPISLKINIEVIDSATNQTNRYIEFEGTSEEFKGIADDLESLIKNIDGI